MQKTITTFLEHEDNAFPVTLQGTFAAQYQVDPCDDSLPEFTSYGLVDYIIMNAETLPEELQALIEDGRHDRRLQEALETSELL